jgi:aminopeptidase N
MRRLVWVLIMSCLAGCSSKNTASEPDPEPGIPLTVANQRSQSIQNLSYNLSFTIPAVVSEPITGHAVIRFAAKDVSQPIVLDFAPGADSLTSVTVGGRPSKYRVVQDHIIIPKDEIASEDNSIDIRFRAGDAPLNRIPSSCTRCLFRPGPTLHFLVLINRI